VSESGYHRSEPAVFRTPDDRLVIYVELGGWGRGDLSSLIREARTASADALWVRGFFVGAGLGFERRGGYARLEANTLTDSVELASPPYSVVRAIQSSCFEGIWGRREPAEPDPIATFVALHEDSEWIGICQFDADTGWIDGPAVIPELRTPDRYARLVRGAAARIAVTPLTLETWGDTDEVIAEYERLGFRLVEYIPGWELQLRDHRGSQDTL
jgi:hypothetical protein